MGMVTRFLMAFGLLFALAFGAAAQEDDDKSAFTRFVEGQLSAPNRQISLNGLEGALSSDVSLSSITISDADGVWLEIIQPRLIWNRSALLTGKLEIEQLKADAIRYLRPPLADESLPDPEATSFSIPDLPVEVVVEDLSVPEVILGAPVMGEEMILGVDGNTRLTDGSLQAELDVDRKDAGGSLDADITFDGETQVLDLDVTLTEPAGGVIATALGLEGKPPVSLSVKGSGPVGDLTTTLTFDVDGKRVLAGDLVLDDTDRGLSITGRLEGQLRDLVAERSRALFGDNSRLSFDALIEKGGAIILQRALMDSGALQATADGALGAEGFPERANLQLRLRDTSEGAVELPGENPVSLRLATARLTYDLALSNDFSATVEVQGFRQGETRFEAMALEIEGMVRNPRDAAGRAVLFTLDGGIDGLSGAPGDPASAFGPDVELVGSGDWAGGPLKLSPLRISDETSRVTASGDLTATQFDGEVKLVADRLEKFAAWLRPGLTGSADLALHGTIGFITGAVDLIVDGQTRDLAIGQEEADRLLAGRTRMSGGIKRDENGLTFNNLRLVNNQASVEIDGTYASTKADLDARIVTDDLAVITDRASGKAVIAARIAGTRLPYATRLSLSLPEGALNGEPVRDLAVNLDGNSTLDAVEGRLVGSARLRGQPVRLNGRIDARAARQEIEGFELTAGAALVRGNALRNEAGLLEGAFTVDAADIASLAALALMEGSGRLQADVSLTADGGEQNGKVEATARDLVIEGTRIGSLEADARFANLFGIPEIIGTVNARNVRAAGLDIETLALDAQNRGDATAFDLDARLATQKARIEASGTLQRGEARQVVALDALSVSSDLVDARLRSPAHVVVEDSTIRLPEPARLAIGDGEMVIRGSGGESLDLRLALSNLPLAIANTVRSDLSLGGRLNGTVDVSGTPQALEYRFNLAGSGLVSAQMRDLGLDPLTASASGSGDLSAINLSRLTLRNGQGIDVSGSGTVPIADGNLGLALRGSAPLALAEPFLANRGASITGATRFDARITGTLENPLANGSLSIADGSLTDPLSNLALRNITLRANLTGEQVSIARASADLRRGGRVTASGTIGISGQMPVDLTIRLADARYSDGQTFTTTAGGNLKLTGALASDPLLSGRIVLDETEIIVPDSFGGSVDLIDVEHIAPPPQMQRTLSRIERTSPVPTPRSRPVILRLDVLVQAPNQIFVRGRGLDAELGGQVRLVGPVTSVSPIGQFDLRRGRLNILTQRLTIDEGRVVLTGDLDPTLFFRITTESDDITATIVLQGKASNLEVTLSSQPELPEDEILARLLFDRSLSDLSPLQIAQLAAAAAELAGGTGSGLAGSIRSAVGVDDIDVVTDEKGGTSVKAGKYISDNVYLGVQGGAQNEATINLDISDAVTARGSVSTEGDSSIGVFIEKDY